jgi:phosphate transport system protein
MGERHAALQEKELSVERHLQVEINELKQTLVRMAGLVEAAIDKAIRSLKERDESLARQVIDCDPDIDRLEIAVENQCVTILARQQPVAVDLRLLVASIKMNNDLERMGDHAVNIAERALSMIQSSPLKPLIDIPRMAGIVQGMVRDSLDAFVRSDAVRAKAVCERDDIVDQLEDQINRELLTYTMQEPKNIPKAMDLSMIAKNLERIADLSTNICEEVIFMVEARTIKHHFEERSGRGTEEG